MSLHSPYTDAFKETHKFASCHNPMEPVEQEINKTDKWNVDAPSGNVYISTFAMQYETTSGGNHGISTSVLAKKHEDAMTFEQVPRFGGEKMNKPRVIEYFTEDKGRPVSNGAVFTR